MKVPSREMLARHSVLLEGGGDSKVAPPPPPLGPPSGGKTGSIAVDRLLAVAASGKAKKLQEKIAVELKKKKEREKEAEEAEEEEEEGEENIYDYPPSSPPLNMEDTTHKEEEEAEAEEGNIYDHIQPNPSSSTFSSSLPRTSLPGLEPSKPHRDAASSASLPRTGPEPSKSHRDAASSASLPRTGPEPSKSHRDAASSASLPRTGPEPSKSHRDISSPASLPQMAPSSHEPLAEVKETLTDDERDSPNIYDVPTDILMIHETKTDQDDLPTTIYDEVIFLDKDPRPLPPTQSPPAPGPQTTPSFGSLGRGAGGPDWRSVNGELASVLPGHSHKPPSLDGPPQGGRFDHTAPLPPPPPLPSLSGGQGDAGSASEQDQSKERDEEVIPSSARKAATSRRRRSDYEEIPSHAEPRPLPPKTSPPPPVAAAVPHPPRGAEQQPEKREEEEEKGEEPDKQVAEEVIDVYGKVTGTGRGKGGVGGGGAGGRRRGGSKGSLPQAGGAHVTLHTGSEETQNDDVFKSQSGKEQGGRSQQSGEERRSSLQGPDDATQYDTVCKMSATSEGVVMRSGSKHVSGFSPPPLPPGPTHSSRDHTQKQQPPSPHTMHAQLSRLPPPTSPKPRKTFFPDDPLPPPPPPHSPPPPSETTPTTIPVPARRTRGLTIPDSSSSSSYAPILAPVPKPRRPQVGGGEAGSSPPTAFRHIPKAQSLERHAGVGQEVGVASPPTQARAKTLDSRPRSPAVTKRPPPHVAPKPSPDISRRHPPRSPDLSTRDVPRPPTTAPKPHPSSSSGSGINPECPPAVGPKPSRQQGMANSPPTRSHRQHRPPSPRQRSVSAAPPPSGSSSSVVGVTNSPRLVARPRNSTSVSTANSNRSPPLPPKPAPAKRPSLTTE